MEEKIPIFLTEAEIEVALGIAQRQGIFPEVSVALNTGLRMSELRRLEWPDVDFERKMLLVRKSKSRRPRMVPLNTKALSALQTQHIKSHEYRYVFPGGRRRTDGTWGKGMWGNSMMRRVNAWVSLLAPIQEAIPKFRQLEKGSVGRGWHLFRHTFASRAVQADVPIYKVSKWLGHVHVTTTEIYAHFAPGFDEDIEKV